jgi:hypothetical protein
VNPRDRRHGETFELLIAEGGTEAFRLPRGLERALEIPEQEMIQAHDPVRLTNPSALTRALEELNRLATVGETLDGAPTQEAFDAQHVVCLAAGHVVA